MEHNDNKELRRRKLNYRNWNGELRKNPKGKEDN
jgi:hypothetical protein